MKVKPKKIIVEMTLIVLFAVATGVVWNHHLLRDVYSGAVAGAAVPSGTPASPQAVILPAGLAQVKDLFDRKEAVFVDAREPFVYASGHIQGAVSVPLAKPDPALEKFIEKVPLDTTLIIYCSGYGCHDSKNLAEKLLPKGFGTILIFEGGYPEWKDAGFPIEGAES